MNFKKNKGFTLIELLVVIAIIGLLSSIVLASLKGARDKSRSTAFKAAINQVVNGLELYKNDNGIYPYSGCVGGSSIGCSFFVNQDGSEVTGPNTLLPLEDSSLLGKYNFKQMPKLNGTTVNKESWTYLANPPSGIGIVWRCAGDTSIPGYVLIVSSDSGNILAGNAVKDWVIGYEAKPGATWLSGLAPDYCFSLK
jgi:prepilin-type N-terminal cleavage/methylation domain-containing protein